MNCTAYATAQLRLTHPDLNLSNSIAPTVYKSKEALECTEVFFVENSSIVYTEEI
jgi:hypothetical protein